MKKLSLFLPIVLIVSGCEYFKMSDTYEIKKFDDKKIVRLNKRTGEIVFVEGNEVRMVDMNIKDVNKSRSSSVTTSEINQSWQWRYSEIATKENNYPILHLRDGYKAINKKENEVLVGWKYEVLNTSPNTDYVVTVNYKFKDKDGFLIDGSSASESVQASQVGKIQHAKLISYDDYSRISNSSWTVGLLPNWKNKKLKNDRFIRASQILKKSAPFWLKDYLISLFITDYPEEGKKQGYWQSQHPNKWIIAKALNIKPEPRLKEISNELGIDFTRYNLPPWNDIINKPNYDKLSKEDKNVLKSFLRVEKRQSDYSPQLGRKFDWDFKEDFPDPITSNIKQ